MASRIPRTGHHGRNVSISLKYPMFGKNTQPSFANSLSNMTRTLLGDQNRNKITTYSRKRPIQFVNKAHFLTPDTPDDFTANVLQEQNVPTVQKQFPQNKHQKLEGGSYSSLVLSKASWQEGSGHALSATRSIMRGGSSLALRNISNIPIEKTLSTTSCRESDISQLTPGHPGRKSESPKLLTPRSARKQRLVQMGRSKHRASQRRVKNVVPVASLTCKQDNATCHSMKTMSTCTQVEISSDIINRCSTAQSIMSMSLCSSTGLTKEEGTPKVSDCCGDSMGAQQPVNSTFGDGSHLEFRETIPQDLSAIIEPCQTEQDDDDDDTLTPEKIHDIPAAEPAGLSNSSRVPNAKNMIPTKKRTLDVSCDKATTEQENKQRAASCFLTSTVVETKDVPCGPTSSSPIDPGKIPPVMLDISEIDCDQTEAAVTTKKQDVTMEDLLVFDPLPLEVSSTVDAHTMANPVPEKDITPESEQEKYLPTATPQHKRRLAYIPTTSKPRELIPCCCLLADWPQEKKSCVTKCKHKASWNAGELDNLPTDVLCLL